MPIPDFETLMRPVLQAFADGADSVSDVVPIIQLKFGVTNDEAAELLPSGRVSIIASRVHWARTYLSKAGLLTSPKRNHHVVTDRGLEILQSNPDRIDNITLSKFDGFKTWKERSTSKLNDTSVVEAPSDQTVSSAKPVSLTPDEIIAQAAKTIEEELSASLLQEVAELSPNASRD